MSLDVFIADDQPGSFRPWARSFRPIFVNADGKLQDGTFSTKTKGSLQHGTSSTKTDGEFPDGFVCANADGKLQDGTFG